VKRGARHLVIGNLDRIGKALRDPGGDVPPEGFLDVDVCARLGSSDPRELGGRRVFVARVARDARSSISA